MKHVVIVESPNKIKSIEKYLGADYRVMASVGHIVFLPSTGEHRFGVDLATWTPNYKVDPEKVNVVRDLKSAVKDADIVYVATDPDREGEAIADNLVTFLDIQNKYKRIRFNEITENAVQMAIASPTAVDDLLVKSQMARRILDRIIGYKLSQLMKTKITSTPTNPSAGRVQSIALKLVVEREREIDAFVPVTYFDLEAVVKGYTDVTAKYYNPERTDNKEWVMPDEVDRIQPELTCELLITDIELSKRSETKQTPLKQAALYKKSDSSLGLSAANVQRAAQRLYEGYGDGGLISYPRTDSTRLSATFVTAAQKYILKEYGEAYLAKEIKGSAGAQDAHEAIRPTSLELTPAMANARFNLSGAEAKVYDLIWTHTVQCLMNVPTRELTRYEMLDGKYHFRMTSSRVTFDGYYKVTGYEKNRELPKFNKGDKLIVDGYKFDEHQTQPPARYNDGSLIEKLDQIGVGRPSTFATTVNILKERGYVDLNGRALMPTDFGKIVLEKLVEAFPHIINEKYTAQMEKELDEIADGKYKYEIILDEFWSMFQRDLATATSEINITQMVPLQAGKKCPKCDNELLIRTNKRDGTRFFGCNQFPTCKHTEPDPTSRRPFKKKFFKKKD